MGHTRLAPLKGQPWCFQGRNLLRHFLAGTFLILTLSGGKPGAQVHTGAATGRLEAPSAGPPGTRWGARPRWDPTCWPQAHPIVFHFS